MTATAKTVPTALAIPSEIQVLFLLSVPSLFKTTLLQNARLLLYTPSNEHFGIVPVEAMQHGLPVLASNTGGPLETLVEGETGWLRDVENVDEWAAVIRRVLHDLTPNKSKRCARAVNNGSPNTLHARRWRPRSTRSCWMCWKASAAATSWSERTS